MHRIHLTYKYSSEPLRHQFSNSGNSLGIGNTNFIWDKKKSQLILIMETSQMISKEIRDEFEDGFMVIGFSEVKLKYGYQYHLISCQAIDSKMIKVILGFTFWGRNGNN